MFSKDELLKKPNYLLTKYQNEIYRQLAEYIKANNLTQNDVAKRLGVSNAYISQILNGNFNFTLKKLIEIGIMIGKVPALEFVDTKEFWKREIENVFTYPTLSISRGMNDIFCEVIIPNSVNRIFKNKNFQSKGIQTINVRELEGFCIN